MRKANDLLDGYNGTEHYHRYLYPTILTDGAKALAEKFGLFWFLDVVASYQSRKLWEQTDYFQTWTLKKSPDGSWVISCDDGNGNVARTQTGEYTDFELDEAEVWVEQLDANQVVILLPSEH